MIFLLRLAVLCCLKAGKLSTASVEEMNFVRSRLMHLSRQKWRSAAEVEGARWNDRQSVNTAGAVSLLLVGFVCRASGLF